MSSETGRVRFPQSIFLCWESKAVIEAAIPLMAHYKRKDRAYAIFDRMFDPTTFDRQKPWFCQLWGVVGAPEDKGGDQLGLAARLMDRPMVELLAYVGPTVEAYPHVMDKAQFDAEYELD